MSASLIIHAHPLAESLSSALFAATVEGLSTDHGPAPATASLAEGDDPTVEDLRSIDTLVFVYPTWWGGPPAILLDWIERRLGPWVDGTPTEPSPLVSVTNLVVVTTHGSPQLLNRVTGEPGRKLFKKSLVPIAAPSCSWHWLAYYGIDADKAETREQFLAGIPSELRRIAGT